jgi:hypothetical protein
VRRLTVSAFAPYRERVAAERALFGETKAERPATATMVLNADLIREESMTDRDELLLRPQRKPFNSLDEAVASLLPTLAARLWETCCWSETMGESWKIGDYRFLILSAQPEKHVEIYVQYWSEPRENVYAEVSSGEWSPGTLKYVRDEQHQFLSTLGYEIGGHAGNFNKEITIGTAAQAGATARETIKILYEGFGYRGTWPVRLKTCQSERADNKPTYDSVTPEDFAKLAAATGLSARVAVDETGDCAVLLRRGRRLIAASMENRVPKNDLYSLILLRTVIRSPVPVTDSTLIELSGGMRFVRLDRMDDANEIGIYMPVNLAGGVTSDWLIQSLATFIGSCRYAEATLREFRKPPKSRGRRDPLVH